MSKELTQAEIDAYEELAQAAKKVREAQEQGDRQRRHQKERRAPAGATA